MATLAVYEQKPPRLTALQWDGSAEAAAWIVAAFGGAISHDAEQNALVFAPIGMGFSETIPPGTWFAEHPQQGIVRFSAEEFEAGWEYVEDLPAEQQPHAPAGEQAGGGQEQGGEQEQGGGQAGAPEFTEPGGSGDGQP